MPLCLRAAAATLVLLFASGPLGAQAPGPSPGPPAIDTTPVNLSGPRVGITFALGNRTVIDDGFSESIVIPPVFSQFGWQFERQLFQTDRGLSAVTEFVPLIGGLEQGKLLPSLTFLVGLRAPSGLEFGLGPNLSPAGAAYAVGVGMTQSFDGVNVPINASAVFADGGVRLSLLTGFTTRR